MGSQIAKTVANGETVAEKHREAAAASPSKANGQENGHVKVNGAAAEGKEDGQANGSTETETTPKKESEKAEDSSAEKSTGCENEKREPVISTEEDAAKAEDGATPSTSNKTPKKKHFSFKKSLKLSGFSFKKAKKVTAVSEEAKTEVAEAAECDLSKDTTEDAATASDNPSESKPEVTPPAEESKAASAGTEEPKGEVNPSEPAIVEPMVSEKEAPAPKETAFAAHEVESTPVLPVESTAE